VLKASERAAQEGVRVVARRARTEREMLRSRARQEKRCDEGKRESRKVSAGGVSRIDIGHRQRHQRVRGCKASAREGGVARRAREQGVVRGC
jgi:hypothetical protein